MIKRLYIILYLFISFGFSFSQTELFFPSDMYMGSSVINDLIQDKWGRIWIATQSGLISYDSHEFRTYSTPELKSVQVHRICEDHYGRLFIGTAAGIQRFDPATKHFTEVVLMRDRRNGGNITNAKNNCFIASLYCRKNGDMLIGTTGFGVFTLKPGENTAWYADEMIPNPELIAVNDIV